MVLTLCDRCLEPFLDDKNYIVKRTKRTEDDEHDPHVGECDICTRRGHNYDVEKNKGKERLMFRRVRHCQPPSMSREQTF